MNTIITQGLRSREDLITYAWQGYITQEQSDQEILWRDRFLDQMKMELLNKLQEDGMFTILATEEPFGGIKYSIKLEIKIPAGHGKAVFEKI